MVMDSFQILLCKTEGNLFVLAAKQGIDSRAFIEFYMNSKTARNYDSDYSHEQWAGEAYLLEQLEDEAGGFPKGPVFDEETLYWTGYLYQYWHLTRGTSSKDIYRIADADTMSKVYPGYHTVGLDLAIDWLIDPR